MITASKSTNIHPMGAKLREMQAVLRYVETHINEVLTPESIAGQHFISLSQLYRDFYAYTGHTIKEYIRKRRISNACTKIKCPDVPFSVIADESGCQTQQAFHKLFKSIVGMTPLEYRYSDTYFTFYPFAVDGISLAVKVGTEYIPACSITRFYDSRLAGIEEKALAALGETKGRVFGRNGRQTGNQFCYEVMIEREGEGRAAFYATCTVDNSESAINDGWNYLYHTWLSGSMFEDSGEGYFEEYLMQKGKPNKLKLYLPVIKRKAAHQIAISNLEETFFLIAKEKGYLAERKAAERVMHFLRDHHPLLMQSIQLFYVCAYDDTWECGVQCGGGFKAPTGSGLELRHVPQGQYAVLLDDCLGDIRVGDVKMERWLQYNGIPQEDRPAFAIYETLDGNYDNAGIRMKLYRKLKNGKNG